MTGFDVDMAKALCVEMKVECTIVKQDWDGMIPGLLARKFDAIISTMDKQTTRPKRAPPPPPAAAPEDVVLLREIRDALRK